MKHCKRLYLDHRLAKVKHVIGGFHRSRSATIPLCGTHDSAPNACASAQTRKVIGHAEQASTGAGTILKRCSAAHKRTPPAAPSLPRQARPGKAARLRPHAYSTRAQRSQKRQSKDASACLSVGLSIARHYARRHISFNAAARRHTRCCAHAHARLARTHTHTQSWPAVTRQWRQTQHCSPRAGGHMDRH